MALMNHSSSGANPQKQLLAVTYLLQNNTQNLFNEVSTSKVRYHEVNGYDALLDVMKTLP